MLRDGASFFCFCFFKQKTAYEMRISDWSSDVCSSDLVAAQVRATEAQRAIADLARTRYREGVANYLEVLDAERNLFIAEQTLIQLRRAELDALVSLYVALGGGQQG